MFKKIILYYMGTQYLNLYLLQKVQLLLNIFLSQLFKVFYYLGILSCRYSPRQLYYYFFFHAIYKCLYELNKLN